MNNSYLYDYNTVALPNLQYNSKHKIKIFEGYKFQLIWTILYDIPKIIDILAALIRVYAPKPVKATQLDKNRKCVEQLQMLPIFFILHTYIVNK